MNVISDAAATGYIDAITKIYLAMRGVDPDQVGGPSNPNSYGLGTLGSDWGAAQYCADVVDAIVDAGSVGPAGIDPVVALGSQAQSLVSRINTRTVAATLLSDPINALSQHLASAGIAGATDLDTFLTVRNTQDVTKWQLLVPPAFATCYYDCFSRYLAIQNVWFEVLQGTVYANALAKIIVGTGVTDGFNGLDVTRYAGGFPKLNVASITGTGTVTVTGIAYDPADKTFKSARTWVANLVSATAGVYALAPGGGNAAPTNSLIAGVDVGGIAVSGGISGGTMYVEAHRPTGRAAFTF